jgi:hypothetical protein
MAPRLRGPAGGRDGRWREQTAQHDDRHIGAAPYGDVRGRIVGVDTSTREPPRDVDVARGVDGDHLTGLVAHQGTEFTGAPDLVAARVMSPGRHGRVDVGSPEPGSDQAVFGGQRQVAGVDSQAACLDSVHPQHTARAVDSDPRCLIGRRSTEAGGPRHRARGGQTGHERIVGTVVGTGVGDHQCTGRRRRRRVVTGHIERTVGRHGDGLADVAPCHAESREQGKC